MRSSLTLLGPVAAALLAACGGGSGDAENTSTPSGTTAAAPSPVDNPTFSEHIAPIIYANCSSCHRPGEPAPFEFLSYGDVSERATQIAEVTGSRYMPPWLPEPGFGHFVGQRHLSTDQIALIKRWVETGAPEGDPALAPQPPQFTPGWQLGEPDFVVEAPEAYQLAAEGRDVYHNFAIRTGLETPRYVRAIEFRPGDTLAVHHAFVLVDPTRSSVNLDQSSPGPGFPGMEVRTNAQSPGGHFISWQPGKTPHPEREGLSWRLAPNHDIVLQLHLRPTGKPESVQPKVGFFFTDKPPTRKPVKIVLASKDIQLPAGAPETVIQTSFRTPVDTLVLGIVPHAHYLGKKLHGFATLPDGTRKWIIRIDDWDFNWQGDYQFQQPLHLPAGSVITQHFTYDNTAGNPHNPNDPPVDVRYGLQSTDEMAELWLQLLAADSAQTGALEGTYTRWNLQRRRTQLEIELEDDTITPAGLTDLGKILIGFNETTRARPLLQRAADEDPTAAEPRYLMGMIAARANAITAARAFFEDAVSVDPEHFAALNGLGNVALKERRYPDAEAHYRAAIAINPEHPVALANLGLSLLNQDRAPDAIPFLEKSLSIRPGHAATIAHLRRAHGQSSGQ